MVNQWGYLNRARLRAAYWGLRLVSGLAAASLGMAGVATASCVNFSGIAIGGGGPTGACQASFWQHRDSDWPHAHRCDEAAHAFAGNHDEFSPLNFAISAGRTASINQLTTAGRVHWSEWLYRHIGNVAFATAGSSALSDGLFNLAGSFGGTRQLHRRRWLRQQRAQSRQRQYPCFRRGVVNNATVLFGDENIVASVKQSARGSGGAYARPTTWRLASSATTTKRVQGLLLGPPDGGRGPLAIAGAIAVNDQYGARAVRNENFGIETQDPV